MSQEQWLDKKSDPSQGLSRQDLKQCLDIAQCIVRETNIGGASANHSSPAKALEYCFNTLCVIQHKINDAPKE